MKKKIMISLILCGLLAGSGQMQAVILNIFNYAAGFCTLGLAAVSANEARKEFKKTQNNNDYPLSEARLTNAISEHAEQFADSFKIKNEWLYQKSKEMQSKSSDLEKKYSKTVGYGAVSSLLMCISLKLLIAF
ncbi:MAG: hypothetical protein WDZ41_01635 [Candidatus Babeliales bacterium]